MKIIQDNLWLCSDCLQAAVNDDYSGLDYNYNDREAELVQTNIKNGLARLGPNLVCASDSDTCESWEEFSLRTCACCKSTLAGERHRFVVLGPDEPPAPRQLTPQELADYDARLKTL